MEASQRPRPVAGMTLTCTRTYVPAAMDGTDMQGQTFDLISKLGAGSFGEVWRCHDRSSGEQRAVKLLFEANMAEVRKECQVNRRVVQATRTKYIPDFCGLVEAELRTLEGQVVHELPVICMQLIDGGSLSDVVPYMKGEEGCIRQVVEDLGSALQRLHGVGVVHLDVKPANVLVDRKGISYLCDFGISIFLPQFAREPEMPLMGTPFYMAPEMLRTRPCRYDEKVDIWALGVLAFELQVGRVPLMRRGQTFVPRPEFIFQILATLDHIDLDPVSDTSDIFQEFFKECLHIDPRHRLNADTLLQHVFISHPAKRGRNPRGAVAALLKRPVDVDDRAAATLAP